MIPRRQPHFTRIDVITDVDNDELEMIVYGNPRAHQRPRFFHGRGLFGRGRGHVYNPDHRLQMQMRDLVQGALAPNLHPIHNPTFFTVESALQVELDIFMKRPDTHFIRQNGELLRTFDNLRPQSRDLLHLRTPDIDNIIKFILDSPLQGVVYANDSRVVRITAAKSWDNEENCNGRVHIRIKKIIQEQANNFIVIDDEEEI